MKTRSLNIRHVQPLALAIAALCSAVSLPVFASSHREAPFITTAPKVDGTDLYMFSSYETGREGFVTLIANYIPLQDAYGGPNFFTLDPNALYEIHVDNNGDAKEDITFQFRAKNTFKDIKLPIGSKNVGIPLFQAGTIADPKAAALNVNESFTVDIVRGDRRTGTRASITNSTGASATFDKPVDYIGKKTIADYAGYAAKHVYTVAIPGCAMPGKVFVGQRQEAFAVNIGPIFDLVNAPVATITDPAQIGALPNPLAEKNVTSLALEVHKSCLVAAGSTEPVIGAWTTASLRQGRLLSPVPKKGYQTTGLDGGAWLQVSRLGMPLVNEVVIGLGDKDRFNGSKPKDDGQFADYVTNPTLPALLEIVLSLPNTAPKNLPRTDLVAAFLTGVKGVNQPATVTPSEMMRLNTSIAAKPLASQNRLGVIGGDTAGYPNGRRPHDDVVDISLVAVMGGLCMANGDGNSLMMGADCKPSNVPLGATSLKLHDAVDQAIVPLLTQFPYLNTPTPGAK